MDDFKATVLIGLVVIAFLSFVWGMVGEYRYRNENEEKEKLAKKLEELEEQHERDLIQKEIEEKANARK